jgi:hypothetical protein
MWRFSSGLIIVFSPANSNQCRRWKVWDQGEC